MCRRITCVACGKPSFSGCGRHVESVLGDVPAAARCRCATTAPAPPPATPTVDEVVADGRLPAPPKD